MKRFFLVTLLVLNLTIVSITPSASASDKVSLSRSLWINPLKIDLSSSKAVEAILQQPVQRFIIPILEEGQTVFPTKSKTFQQMPSYLGKDDVLQSFITNAHASGKQVYALVDCLHWSDVGGLDAKDGLKDHPELAERTLEDEFGQFSKEIYASPFHPQVRQVLQEFVQELSVRYPELDGLALQCRLPQKYWLGFSKTARVAFLREEQVDPVDLFKSQSDEPLLFQKWLKWRQEKVDLLVKQLSSTFRAAVPGGKVAVVGYANTYRLSPALLARTLEDWRSWVRQGLADEVILQPRPELPGKDLYAHALDVVEKANHPDTLVTWLLELRQGDKENNPYVLLEELSGQGVTSLSVRVSQESDLARASVLWSDILPEIEPALRSKGEIVSLFQIKPEQIFFGLVTSREGASRVFKITHRNSAAFEVTKVVAPSGVQASFEPDTANKNSWTIKLEIPGGSQPAVLQKDVIITVARAASPKTPLMTVDLQVPVYAIIK